MCQWLTVAYTSRTFRLSPSALAALVLASCSRSQPAPRPTPEAVLSRPDPGGWRHRDAVEALGKRGDATAIAPLAAVIEAAPGKHEFFLKRLAARALGNIRDARSAEILTRNLLAAEGLLRLEEDCREGLARLGALAVPALAAKLDADRQVAPAAARALAAIDAPAAREALQAAGKSAIGPVRRAIEEALAGGARIWDKGAPDSGAMTR